MRKRHSSRRRSSVVSQVEKMAEIGFGFDVYFGIRRDGKDWRSEIAPTKGSKTCAEGRERRCSMSKERHRSAKAARSRSSLKARARLEEEGSSVVCLNGRGYVICGNYRRRRAGSAVGKRRRESVVVIARNRAEDLDDVDGTWLEGAEMSYVGGCD